MTTANDSFAELVFGKVRTTGEFVPQVYYDKDGDSIEFLWSDDMFRGERIDSLVTVYYSEETNEIVGSLIKGVRAFLKDVVSRVPGFKIEIEDGSVRLEHIFTVQLWHNQEAITPTAVRAYRRLRDEAERIDATAELCASG